MDDHPGTTPVIGVYPSFAEYKVVEAKSVEITVDLVNLTTSGDYFKLAVENVPVAWIKFLPSQFVFLEHGEKKQVSISISVPMGFAGKYNIKINVSRKTDEIQAGEAHVGLTVTTVDEVEDTTPVQTKPEETAAFQARGRVGVVLKEVRFYVVPGEVLSIPVQLTNQSLEDERLNLVVQSKEIPPGWVTVQPAFIELVAGKTQTMTLKISPPKKYSSKAGRYPFVLEVHSARFADTPASVDCLLTVTAYTQSTIQVSPLQVFAEQPMQVRIENAGNTAETFEVSWEGPDRSLLAFEVLPPPPVISTTGATTQAVGMTRMHQPPPGTAGLIRVEPGKAGTLQFKGAPINRPILGRPRRYDFQTKVAASDRQARLFSCSLTAQPLIPSWALIAIVAAFVFSFCALVFLVSRLGSEGGDQTSAANTQAALIVQQTAAANQTATAVLALDSDGDGLSDILEIGLGTNPNQTDTDLDKLSDGDEVNNRKTDPKKADTDGDGLTDGDEVARGINPLLVDTDGDGLNDADEIRIGSDPKVVDTDQDGLSDKDELTTCNSPTDPDSDDDGIVDSKDQNPCDKNNPSLTQTALASIPTFTPTISPTPTPTFTPTPTTAPVPLTPTPTATPSLPSLPGILIFSSNREGKLQIYARHMNTGSITRVTFTSGDETHGAWSPDGSRIAFTSNRDGNHDIYIMDAAGANQINLTNNPADDINPAWSPDGQWIVFSTNRDTNYEIYMMRADGSQLQNITNNPSNDMQPFWGISPGSSTGPDMILFVTDRDGNQEIYGMRPDGQSLVNLTNNGANDYAPVISPNGSRIAFASLRTGDADIYVMDINGGNPVNLTPDSTGNDDSPDWSGDNEWIAYVSTTPGNPDIFIIKADGSVRYNVTAFQADDRDPSWR